MLTTINEIKSYFKTNTTPLFFISATNFNLLGLDEWISQFKFITYIDSFNGQHPNLFCPKEELPHDEFQSIEDINNYLLQHAEVLTYIKANTPAGAQAKVLFLMFDEKTEQLAAQAGLEVCFPKATLRTFLDNKVNTNRIAEKAGVACVPYVLAAVKNYAHLKTLTPHLGNDLVIQTPFGDSGHTTFFIANETDFEKHSEDILKEDEVKIMKRINCYGTAIEGCVTQHGTLVGPLMTELVGFKTLTPYQGGWCGNELFPDAFTESIRAKALEYTQQFGNQLYKEGYKGYFELDFLIDKDSGAIYLGELNPRVSGVSSLTNHAKFAYQDVPLFLFHLLEWLNVPYQIDVASLNHQWALPQNQDSWSQLVIKHPFKTVEVVTKAPQSGIWEIKTNGNLNYKQHDTKRQSVNGDNEAFYFQITQTNNYLYEGADLGILLLKGRVMDANFELNERGKRWVKALRAKYEAQMIDFSALSGEELLEAGFKVL